MKRLLLVATVVAVAVLALAASTTNASHDPATVAPLAVQPLGQQGAPNGNVGVRFRVKKFVRVGKALKAVGQAVATFTDPNGQKTTVAKAFTAKVGIAKRPASANSVCPILFLQIKKLSLVLLGLHVDLDQVTLTIVAYSGGGPLGSLFCSIFHTKVKLLHSAKTLTQVAHRSGLATNGLNFAVPVQGQTTDPNAPALCQILDLTVGPIDLELLGLYVHLSAVHLTITADPNGGPLGKLFCSFTQ
jgi:hypothetical protein